MPPETPITPAPVLSPTPPVSPTPIVPAPQPKIRAPFLWGLAAAVVISGAIIAIPSILPPKPPTKPQSIAQTPPTTPTPAPLTLTLTHPSDGELAVNQEVVVEGQTAPNTTVVIFTETDEETIESDANGKFSTTISLSTGINSLTITAFSDSGEEKSISIDIVYDA